MRVSANALSPRVSIMTATKPANIFRRKRPVHVFLRMRVGLVMRQGSDRSRTPYVAYRKDALRGLERGAVSSR